MAASPVGTGGMKKGLQKQAFLLLPSMPPQVP